MNKKNKKNKINTQLDICIPVYGSFEILQQNLDSLAEACGDIKYRIFLVDDQSPDLEEKGKEFYRKFQLDKEHFGGLSFHKKNTGFPQTANDAVVMGRSELVMLLNTDVVLHKDSVKIMVDHILGSPEVGIVFPKLIFFENSNDPSRPKGKIQHCGIVFDIHANPYHIFNGWDADHPFVNHVKDFNACTGACFIIRRELWNKTKGFDLDYGQGSGEDVQLCIQVRILGKLIRYLPQAVGQHYTGSSAERYKKAYPVGRNIQILKTRFGDLLPFDDWLFSM